MIERDYTLREVAADLQVSTRWLRDKVRSGAEHQRYGNRIRFSAAQVEAIKQSLASKREAPAQTSITTGRRRSA